MDNKTDSPKRVKAEDNQEASQKNVDKEMAKEYDENMKCDQSALEELHASEESNPDEKKPDTVSDNINEMRKRMEDQQERIAILFKKVDALEAAYNVKTDTIQTSKEEKTKDDDAMENQSQQQ